MEMGQNRSFLALTNPIISDGKGKQPNEKGLSRRHEMVAQLACRGLDAKAIAEQVRLSPKRVREILRGEEVIREITRITAEMFREVDHHLVSLYQKALVKLDEHLESSNLEIQDKAMDRIFRFFQPKGDVKAKPLIAQFFSGGMQQGNEDLGKRLDQIVLQKRRERGLPDYPDEEDL